MPSTNADPSRPSSAAADGPRTYVKLFEEVAILFRDGQGPVDLEELKTRLIKCAEDNERHPEGSDSSGDYFASVDRLFEYLDAHSLKSSDIVAIRDWQAGSLECRDVANIDGESAIATRISRALRRVWGSVGRDEGAYAPRHAVLCDVMGHPAVTFPGLSSLASKIQRKQRGGSGNGSDFGAPIAAFLLNPENKGLWDAVLQESELLYPVRNGPRHFDASDLVDGMLANKGDQVAFKQKLQQFQPLAQHLLKAYPHHAVPEKLNDARRLRVVRNIVHAYGDDETKASYQKYIEDLREYFAERADNVTVTWLDQVMEKPGKPPEKYVVRLRLGKPEKRDQK